MNLLPPHPHVIHVTSDMSGVYGGGLAVDALVERSIVSEKYDKKLNTVL